MGFGPRAQPFQSLCGMHLSGILLTFSFINFSFLIEFIGVTLANKIT